VAALARRGAIKPLLVRDAIRKLGIDPEKVNPMRA
jgi:pyruvate dehydrogenase complex dehydrogenase (E1) component